MGPRVISQWTSEAKNIMSPAVTAVLRKPRENPSLGKKSAKVNHCFYSSTEQLQVAL